MTAIDSIFCSVPTVPTMGGGDLKLFEGSGFSQQQRSKLRKIINTNKRKTCIIGRCIHIL